MIPYDAEERGHQHGTCHTCGYHGWSDDSGMCPRCTPSEDTQGCPECGATTDDGDYCGDCLSERASYYTPDEGGQG